jgi:uncharacterized protein (DUF433 family)
MIDDPYVNEVPGVNGGYPVVRPTRIPVRTIVKFYREIGNVEGVQDLLCNLSREQIQGALDYYAAHPERVDEDIERNERAWQELQRRAWPA